MEAAKAALLETVDNSRLSDGQYGEVLRALSPCRAQFFTVGIALGVSSEALVAIRNAPQGTAPVKLSLVLIEFFKLDASNSATWQTIIDVLNEGINPALANEIASDPTVNSTQKLGKDDVEKIMDKIRRIAAQWSTFGALLGVPSWQIAIIRDQDMKLNRVVDEFFLLPNRTWREVVAAIYSDNPRHAKDIAGKHLISGANQGLHRDVQPDSEVPTLVQQEAATNRGENVAIDGIDAADGQGTAVNNNNIFPATNRADNATGQAMDTKVLPTEGTDDAGQTNPRKGIDCI